MATINSAFDQNLKLIFSKDQSENLRSCIQHCNLQIKNEQRSWTKIVYDNKITTGTLLASCLITRFALNSVFSMSMIAFPFVVVSVLYATYKFSSLQNEANDRFAKTQKVFCDVFGKYKAEEVSSEKDYAIDTFIQGFTNSPRTCFSLEAKKNIDKIVEKYGNNHGLGPLTKIVFSQAVKDQRHLDKISGYQTTFHMGSIATFLIALNIDQFFTPYSFLVSKPFLIISVLFTAGAIGGFATYNYIKHSNDHKIGEDLFKENLNYLNDVLDISQGHRAYV